MRCLIGIGTTICGASAIAALAPVIRAKAEEIAYSITVVFFFNMVAVFTFPTLGHLLGSQRQRFWHMGRDRGQRHVGGGGRRVRLQPGRRHHRDHRQADPHDPDHSAGAGLRAGRCPFVVRDEIAATQSLARRVYAAVPTFIILFVLAAAANTGGLIGPYGMQVQRLGRLVMIVALAAVGLQGHWRAFVGAGSRPLILGLATWFVVAVSGLAVQTWTQTL